MWNRWGLSPVWNIEELWMVREKTGTVMRWCVLDEVNQEESEQNEVDGMKEELDCRGEAMHIEKSGCWLVTIDEDRILRVVLSPHLFHWLPKWRSGRGSECQRPAVPRCRNADIVSSQWPAVDDVRWTRQCTWLTGVIQVDRCYAVFASDDAASSPAATVARPASVPTSTTH